MDLLLLIVPHPVLMDPCAGEGAIFNTLKQQLSTGYDVGSFVTNDICTAYVTDYHFDAVDPEAWACMPYHIDVIVCSPPFEIIDVWVPDLVLRASTLVMYMPLVTGLVMEQHTERCWWSYLQSQGSRTAELRGFA